MNIILGFAVCFMHFSSSVMFPTIINHKRIDSVQIYANVKLCDLLFFCVNEYASPTEKKYFSALIC